MKIIICILVLTSSNCFGCPKLEGKWNSSASLTNKFNDQRAIIEEKTREFRSQLIGKSTTEYRNGKLIITMPPIEQVIISGKSYPWDSSEIRSKYTLLACTKNSVVIRYTVFGSTFISVLSFESSDVYWVYDGQVGGNGNDHTREYFTRAKDH